MSDATYPRASRPPISRSDEWWHLAAALLGLLFGNLCLRWSPMLAFEASVAMAVLLVCLVRPFAGVLLTLGLALSLEQYAIITGGAVRLDSFTLSLGEAFFTNLNTLARIPWLYLNAMELLLLLCLFSWAIRALRRHTLRWRGGPLALPLLLMLVAMLVAVARGVANGGEGRIAMWEIRAFLQLGLAYFVAAHLIERRSQVRALVWVVIGALLFRTAMALWNAGVVLHFQLSLVEAVAPHEDALFFVSLILLWALLTLYRAEPAQRRVLAISLLALLVALVASKRRAGIMALLVGIPYLLMLLDRRRLKRALLYCVALSIPAGLYTLVLWNSESTAALPIRMVRSIITSRKTARDAASNRFRVLENEILFADIRTHPFLGMGFGHPYRGRMQDERNLQAREADAELPRLQFEMARYVAHNQILWVWAKAGLVGFVAFWFFVTLSVSYGTRLALSLRDPYFRALAAAVVLLVGLQMLVSFVDQELTCYRNAAYVGLMLGMLTRLRGIEKEESLQGS